MCLRTQIHISTRARGLGAWLAGVFLTACSAEIPNEVDASVVVDAFTDAANARDADVGAPVGAPCDFESCEGAAVCIDPNAACESGLCAFDTLGEEDASYCTQRCEATACPEGFRCHMSDSGQRVCLVDSDA